MKDKEKQIEEMAKLDIEESAGFYSAFINDIRISKNKPLSTSKTIISFDCPKNYILQAIGISKDSVVLSREELHEVEENAYQVGVAIGKKVGGKETAEKILKWLIEHTFESCIFETYFREEFGVEVE